MGVFWPLYAPPVRCPTICGSFSDQVRCPYDNRPCVPLDAPAATHRLALSFLLPLFFSMCRQDNPLPAPPLLFSNALSGVSVFVSIILAFLIVYASRFLIKRRNKEFGVYLTLGMSKKKISLILFIETLIIGIVSLVVGLVSYFYFSIILIFLNYKKFIFYAFL